jgi:branched-subunit amino acid transport protein
MLTIWICVALTALASFAIKATGPAILGNRPLPPRASGVIALLAPALLAGLVISDMLGANWSSANPPLALGVLTAAVARTTRLPPPACVIAAVAVTAIARAAL